MLYCINYAMSIKRKDSSINVAVKQRFESCDESADYFGRHLYQQLLLLVIGYWLLWGRPSLEPVSSL